MKFRVCFLFLFVLIPLLAANQGAVYEDLTKIEELVPGKTYRMGESGICGTVESDHILVTDIIPGSKAHGKIQKGDLVVGMQHRGMGGWGGIPNLVKKRLYRIGRDWDWHFYVTVERPSLRNGKGNSLTYDLHMDPTPGQICHYGPTGFFAKRFSDHLIVESIAEGSPSYGVLKIGDIILAVGGRTISVDAYQEFTDAIDDAESEKGKGKLMLTIRRSKAATTGSKEGEESGETEQNSKLDHSKKLPLGERMDVVLQLKVMGSHGVRTPLDCDKTDSLIRLTSDLISEKTSFGLLNTELLGLLATGEKKQIEVVKNFLHDPKKAPWAQPPVNPMENLNAKGLVSWTWGYRNLLLTEYYLMTGDTHVLPAIGQLSRTLASGQDQAGLWGHRMRHPERGRAYGYGVMNQPTLPIFISLILSKKCGFKDEVVLDAIKRTHDHYARWIGQGALPYGNHGPKETEFTNNGTSGSLAVAFALLGNLEGARFYGSLSAAASEEILCGHGGPWWNILWSGLGANILGPEMTQRYNAKIHWLRTITRTWTGRYVGLKGWGSSQGSSKTSSTGSHLLNLCSGRRKLHITGKGMLPSIWVNAKEAKEIVDAGDLEEGSVEALVQYLGSPFPPVRLRSAQALAKKDAKIEIELKKILSEGTHDQMVGALHAIESLRVEGLEYDIMSLISSDQEPTWVRQSALRVLGKMEGAKVFAPVVLKLLVGHRKDQNDPRGDLDRAIGAALVNLYSPSPFLTDLDKDLFYRGVTKLLYHPHNSARASAMALLKDMPREDLPIMIDHLVYLIEDKDRSYTSYTGAGRQEALEILYHHGIKESLAYTINTIKEPTGRGGPRYRARTRLLNQFGAEAKGLIPRINEVLGDKAKPIVEKIQKSELTKKMVSIDELKAEPAKKTRHFLSNPFMR
jgi:hypothetical protein